MFLSAFKMPGGQIIRSVVLSSLFFTMVEIRPSFAQSYDKRNPLSIEGTAKFAEAKESLKKYFSIDRKSFQKNWKFYHYFNSGLPPVENEKDGNERGINQILKYIEYSQQVNASINPRAIAGLGLYAATDPLVSEDYGMEAIEFSIASDKKYYYLPSNCSVNKMNSKFLAEIQNSKELDGDIKQWILNTLGNSSCYEINGKINMIERNENLKSKVRDLFLSVFRDLDVIAFEYEYDTVTRYFCANFSESAFVFIGDFSDHSQFKSINTHLFQLKYFTKDWLSVSQEMKKAFDKNYLSWRDGLEKKIEILEYLDQVNITAQSKLLSSHNQSESVSGLITFDSLLRTDKEQSRYKDEINQLRQETFGCGNE